MALKPSASAVKSSASRSSAQPHQLDGSDRRRGYLRNHREVALGSLQRLLADPIATLMTVAVMAIALTLPMVLYVGLQNMQALSEEWRGGSQLSLFLDAELSESAGRDLAAQLAQNTQVASSLYLSKAEALEEFKRYSGLGDAVALLAHNPLPAVILLQPTADYQQAQQMHQLAEQLGAVDGVSDVVLDLEWVARLQALLGFAERALVLLAGLLALGVLLVVGNTIRLEIENRRDEIVVVKLVGGTDAFVRRPLLYSGFWYGIGAGGLAWGLIQLLLLYLASALATLIGLYPGDYALIGLDLVSSLVLLVMSGLLGTAGAWLAVVRHLAAVEPR